MSRSRELRALFFIFTMLSLLYSASSWIDKNKLREIKENVEMLKREALRRRVNNMVDNAFIPWIIQWSTQLIERKMDRDRLQDFPTLAETLQSVHNVTKACNAFIKKGLQKEATKIKDYVKKVAQLEKIIMNLEIEKSDL